MSLPTWKSCVGYEEGEQWVLNKMKNGYPRSFAQGRRCYDAGSCYRYRFFIDPAIARFSDAILKKYGSPTQRALLLPSRATGARCIDFFQQQVPSLKEGQVLKAIELYPRQASFDQNSNCIGQQPTPIVVAVIFPHDNYKLAKMFWQHTGDGISSRRAEVCHRALENGQLISSPSLLGGLLNGLSEISKGPQRYRKQSTGKMNGLEQFSEAQHQRDHVQFVEERFGRNLDTKLAANARLAIRRRIAGALTADVDLSEALERTEATGQEREIQGLLVDDVYLYPSGMSAIFNTHRTMMECRGLLKSICFGSVDQFVMFTVRRPIRLIASRFPYIDTLKILEKWGPGCVFYGHGVSDDIDDLERRCAGGESFLALFCEFPGNPLLKTPDIGRLRSLADRYDFAIVIDETIGNFLNVHVLHYADVIVSSLTKVFSGDSNVMGGRYEGSFCTYGCADNLVVLYGTRNESTIAS